MVGMALELKRFVETNLCNKSKIKLYKSLLRLYSHLKQLYINNKTKHFSYIGGCGVRRRTCIEVLKRREATEATDKWLWVISNVMSVVTLIN